VQYIINDIRQYKKNKIFQYCVFYINNLKVIFTVLIVKNVIYQLFLSHIVYIIPAVQLLSLIYKYIFFSYNIELEYRARITHSS